ncbi:MAG: DUF2510 domain-containing protein [Nigerium sp.]|nr:DUF2510 domain-containing protein [Nigerium sp.]
MQFTEKGVRWVRQSDRAGKASQLGKAALPDELLPVLGLVAVAAIPIVLLLGHSERVQQQRQIEADNARARAIEAAERQVHLKIELARARAQEAAALRAQQYPVAGWLTDGRGTVRWWDGARWTEHVLYAIPTPAPQQAIASSGVIQQPDQLRVPSVEMSFDEWRARLQSCFRERVLTEIEWRFLMAARITDGSAEATQLQGYLRSVTAQEFSARLDRALTQGGPQVYSSLKAAASGQPFSYYGFPQRTTSHSCPSPAAARLGHRSPRSRIGMTTAQATGAGGTAAPGPSTAPDT